MDAVIAYLKANWNWIWLFIICLWITYLIALANLEFTSWWRRQDYYTKAKIKRFFYLPKP